jgi:uncharacterized protein (TIGR03437 family)
VAIQAAAGDALVEERLTVLASGKPVLSVPGKQYVTLGSRLSFEVKAASGAGAVTLSAHSIPAGASFDASIGLFEWTPGAPGNERVTFLASDVTGASATADVLIQAGNGAPVAESLQNAASGSSDAVCSRGALATLRGGWLANGSGTEVLINGASVSTVLASPTAVTFPCPEATVGSRLSVAVRTAAGRSAALTTVMRDSVPGIFTVSGSANGQAVASILERRQLAMPRDARDLGVPAQPGDVLRIAVTGIPEDVDPALVTVQFGDLLVPAAWVRPVANALGVTQIGVTLPVATPVSNSLPVAIQRQLPSGQVATSQTVSIATEAVQQ